MVTVVEPPVARKQEMKQEGPQLISRGVRARPLFDPEILRRAIKESFIKLNPRMVIKNPVMFVVEVGAALTTVFVIKDAITGVGGATERFHLTAEDRLEAEIIGSVITTAGQKKPTALAQPRNSLRLALMGYDHEIRRS